MGQKEKSKINYLIFHIKNLIKKRKLMQKKRNTKDQRINQ